MSLLMSILFVPISLCSNKVTLMKEWGEIYLAISGITSLDICSSCGGRSWVIGMNFPRLTARYLEMANGGLRFFRVK